MVGASGLSDDDDGKNDGLKWKLAESDPKEEIEGFGSVQIMDLYEGGPKSNQNTYKFSHLYHNTLKGQ